MKGKIFMREEDVLSKKLGKENPFTVPEGYFEHLTSRVMDALPPQEEATVHTQTVSLWSRVKPLLYLAAMFVGAALIIRVAMPGSGGSGNGIAEADTESSFDVSDEMLGYMLDRAMLDDYSLYVYLTDAGTVSE